MKAEILCVGSELLLGQIIDTNAAYMAGQLARAGVDVHRKQTVGDNLERIADCIRGALGRADALVITGGLGPTTDDLTREGIALALGVELEHRPELEDGLREMFKARNYTPPVTFMRQAYLPQGGTAIPNANGTAPGVRFEREGKVIYSVPGVPKEMRGMIDDFIVPDLLSRLEGTPGIIVSRVLRSFGLGESLLAEPIEDILTGSQNPTAAPLIFGNTEVHVRLTAKAANSEEAKTMLDELEARIRDRVGEHIFGADKDTMQSVVVGLLRERGLTVALGESLTGGLVGELITEVPGSSEVFQGGVMAYTDDAKTDVLDVPRSVLSGPGPVSDECARWMSLGAQRIGRADFGLSTTGEAGPQSQSGAPVGTVYIGLASDDEPITIKRELWGDRDTIRRRAALWSLDVLRRYLLGLPLPE